MPNDHTASRSPQQQGCTRNPETVQSSLQQHRALWTRRDAMPLSRKQKRSAGASLVRPQLHRPGWAGLPASKLFSTAPLTQQQATQRWRKTKSLPTRLHRAARATPHITRDWMVRCQRPRKTSSWRALLVSLDVEVKQKRKGSQLA